jgi:hypothetical protein
MDTNQPSTFSTPPPGVFGTKIPSSVAFAVGILLFLLPFAEIKCNNATLMQNTGLGIAMGSEWKISEKNMLGGLSGSGNALQTDKTKNDPNFYAIAALALGLTGLILSLLNARAAAGSALVSGVLSAGSLIALMFDLKKWFNIKAAADATEKAQEGVNNLGMEKIGNTMNNMKPTLDFTPWFYIAGVAFLIAAFFCYKRIQAIKR